MHADAALINLPEHTRPAPPAKPRGWRWWLFIFSFFLALGAAVSMVVHAADARGSGKENASTPGLLLAVQCLKLPKLVEKAKVNGSSVNYMLVAGTGLALIAWAIALGYAV